MTKQEDTSLAGLRVLVPRGGAWGHVVAKALRMQGAAPVISPLIDFAHTSEQERLRESLSKLEAGYFDWVTATNPTIVDILNHHNIKIAKRTQVAVVGETTHAAFVEAGYEVARTTDDSDPTTQGLLKSWPEINQTKTLRVLTLRSDAAKPVLSLGLIERGHDVTQLVAYRTVGVPASIHIREDIAKGEINALLISSPQIAREVAKQFANRPETTLIACIGKKARAEAAALELPERSENELIEAQRHALVQTVLGALNPADMMD
ncbi:uroporphyrinogen-III synthase [Canibacter sp. lx-72]|uniref:uroporphyrinogen-III synthase n=1 Tax=Canibacter zhuwentaonis TaxID=2837491 RepID=UPI001BDD11D5|nr:uroporphyrinogen-III synthase [Canibacter zhuwentaonis]MBT1018094.1 uroporphyrinogen-III synthase [Canibacter zhuwentaonis]